jgi:hypothetical protein
MVGARRRVQPQPAQILLGYGVEWIDSDGYLIRL